MEAGADRARGDPQGRALADGAGTRPTGATGGGTVDDLPEVKPVQRRHVVPILSFQGITYEVPTKETPLGVKLGNGLRQRRGKQIPSDRWIGYKRILDDVSGDVHVGEFLAIMGPSGAGKTTLADILFSRGKKKTRSGTIRFMGRELGPWMKPYVGYCKQEDVMFPTETVREALAFAARLRRRNDETPVDEAVEEVARLVGLSHVLDSKIGSQAGQGLHAGSKTGLSGGERRRTTLAVEILAKPKLLMCDEPTSGLDQVSAMKVVTLLRDLTLGKLYGEKIAVIATIHQPSRDIWAMFDRVMLLSRGKVFYFGPAADVPKAFARLGYIIPPKTNPADYMMKVATNSSEMDEEFPHQYHERYLIFPAAAREEWQKRLHTRLQDATVENGGDDNSSAHRITLDRTATGVETTSLATGAAIAGAGTGLLLAGERTDRASMANNTSYTTTDNGNRRTRESSNIRQKVVPIPFLLPGKTVRPHSVNVKSKLPVIATEKIFRKRPPKKPKPKRLPYAASYGTQLHMNFRRFIHQRLRDPASSIVILAQFIINAFFAGTLFWQLDDTVEYMTNRAGVLFFSLTVIAFGATFATSVNLIENRIIYIREHAVSTYRTSTFVIPYFVILIFMEIIWVLVYCSIMYFMVGLNQDRWRFVYFLLISFLTIFVSMSFGTAVITLFKTYEVGIVVGMLLLVIWFVLGGLFINNETLPGFYKALALTSFMKWSFEALLVTNFEGMVFECAPGEESGTTAGLECPMSWETALEQLGFPGRTISNTLLKDCMILFGMGVLFTLMTYLNTKYRRFG